MSPSAIIMLVLAGTLAGLLAGFIVGREFGRQCGRDEQWVDDFITQAKREAARHDKSGKFCTRSRGHS